MALRDQPYIPLYVMDFSTDEKLANCSAESTGVYIRLMCILHKMEEYGVIELKAKEKQDENNIHNFAFKLVRQMPYDVTCIERSLKELVEEGVIILEGDRLYQKRMVQDGEISRKRSAAGSKGGKVSRDSDKQTASKTMKNDTPERNISKENPIKEQFNMFWEVYPRKSGKGSAEKAWYKISPSQKLFDEIMLALDVAKQCSQWKKDDGQFIPYPATWLNQKRWEDDYGVPEIDRDKHNTDFDPDNPYADWSDDK